MYHLLTEEGSNIVFAVLKSESNQKDETTRNRNEAVALAVKEEWSYETVELVDWDYDDVSNNMSFDCTTEDGDEEIRVIELSKTALYE